MRRSAAPLPLVLLCSALALAACGGGGGDGGGATPPAATQSDPQDSADAALKTSDLTGTWRACKADSATTSLEDKYTFTADSTTQVSYKYVHTAFPSTDCSGNASGYLERSGTIQFDATTTLVDGTQAQKVTFKPANLGMHNMSFNGSPTASYKQLLAIPSAGVLQEGDASQLGADGYPTALQSLEYAQLP